MTQKLFGPGSAQSSQGLTFTAFFSSLTVSLLLFLIQMILFIFLRKRLPHIYEPKTFLVPRNQLTDSPSSTLFGWLIPLLSTSLDQIKVKCTLDEYFFLRFLYLLLFLFMCSTCVILPLLGAINWISGSNYGDKKQESNTLENLSWLNISPQHYNRRSIHLVVALFFILFIAWLIYFELEEYTKIRHSILSSQSHNQSVSSRTILLRSIPKKYQNEEKIKELFQIFPYSVKSVCINRDYTPLVKLINKRRVIARRLECLENYIVWKCNQKNRQKHETVCAGNTVPNVNKNKKSMLFSSIPILPLSQNNLHSQAFSEDPDTLVYETTSSCYHSSLPGKKWTKYMKETDIPKVRLPLFRVLGIPITIPFYGLQIDSLTWYKIELNRLNAEIKLLQTNPKIFPPINSCFIEFHHQIYAHLSCQAIVFENPQLSGQSFIELDPNNINWNNIDLSWFQFFIRRLIATVLNIIIILGWTFPVAIIAILSQLDYLPGLSPQAFIWINHIPARFRIMISSVLPSIAVSSLMGFAPMIFRYLARIKGYSSRVEVDLDVQKYLFGFIFIQIFLVISLSRGMTAVVAHVLLSPFSAISLLASNLPKSANFFYSFIFLQGLSLSGSIFLQTGRLLKAYIIKPFFDQTPHDKFETIADIGSLQWGSLYPNITCLAIIGVVYSVIAPLVTFFSTIAFGLLFISYKYRILYCNSKAEREDFIIFQNIWRFIKN